MAHPDWHFLIAAPFSFLIFLVDCLFSGKESTYRIMKRLKLNQKHAMFRLSYLNHYYSNRAIYNYGWLLYSNVEKIKKAINQFEVVGLKHLEHALNCDKGVIIFSAHVGCFFNVLFCEQIVKLVNGRKVALLSPENKEKRKMQIKNQIRRTFTDLNFDLIDITNKREGINIIRTLKKKGIIGCTLDYAYPYTRNKEIEFFGRKVEFPIGLVEISRKIEVVYLPCFSYIKKGRTTLEFMEMFHSIKSEDAERDIDTTSAKINTILENKIMEIPEQWSFWLRLFTAKPT